MVNPAVPFRFTRRNNRIPAFLFLVWLLAGCGPNNSSENSQESEAHRSASTEDAAPEVHTDLFPGLTAFYKKQYPAFDPTAFEMTGELRDQQYITTAYDEKQAAAFRPLLTYNADSSMALDMFSGSYVAFSKNGQTKFEPGEPDTEVAVIDFKSNTRKRIFYTGPSFLVQDVQWVNDSVILLAGAMPYDPDMVIPQIHRIFLAEGIHEIYEIRDPAPVNFNEYHQEIIKTKLDGRKKEF